MAKSFREMVAWQLAFELKTQVILLIKDSPAARDFKFRDQLADSARSVPSNIAEGFGRFNPAETMHFLDIARGSLDETENHLRDGVVSSYFPAESVGPLIKLIARCRAAISAWHSYLRTVKKDPRFQSRGDRTLVPNRRREPSCRTLVPNPRAEPSFTNRQAFRGLFAGARRR
jgi:four helix bundle protein